MPRCRKPLGVGAKRPTKGAALSLLCPLFCCVFDININLPSKIKNNVAVH
ncbi:hypothetical protein [uncultured Phascolarctobacterium sp.]|nr:hypothetical protein [uncultured Phascolarctobacterium sp.]